MPGVSLAAAAKSGLARGGERSGFGALPPLVQLGVGLVTVTGVAIAAAGLVALPSSPWPTLVALLLLSILTGAAKIDVPLARGGSALSLPYITSLLSVLLLGPWPSVPVAVAGAWSGTFFRERDSRSWYRTLFTLGSTAMSVAAAGLVYRGGMALLPAGFWTGAGAAMGAATAYYLVTTGLVGLVMAASTEDPMRRAIERRILSSAPGYYVGAAVALVVAEVAHGGQYLVVGCLRDPGLPGVQELPGPRGRDRRGTPAGQRDVGRPPGDGPRAGVGHRGQGQHDPGPG